MFKKIISVLNQENMLTFTEKITINDYDDKDDTLPDR